MVRHELGDVQAKKKADSRTNPSTRRPSPREIRAAALRNKRWAGSFLALAVRRDPRGLFARARGIALAIASRKSKYGPGMRTLPEQMGRLGMFLVQESCEPFSKAVIARGRLLE